MKNFKDIFNHNSLIQVGLQEAGGQGEVHEGAPDVSQDQLSSSNVHLTYDKLDKRLFAWAKDYFNFRRLEGALLEHSGQVQGGVQGDDQQQV